MRGTDNRNWGHSKDCDDKPFKLISWCAKKLDLTNLVSFTPKKEKTLKNRNLLILCHYDALGGYFLWKLFFLKCWGLVKQEFNQSLFKQTSYLFSWKMHKLQSLFLFYTFYILSSLLFNTLICKKKQPLLKKKNVTFLYLFFSQFVLFHPWQTYTINNQSRQKA